MQEKKDGSNMGDMGLLEWALMFDKITWVDYLLIHVGLFAVFLIAVGINHYRNR